MKLSCYRQLIRPKYRFATSQGGVDEKEVIFVRLDHEGITGWGEVVPSALYGQSLEASEAALRAMGDELGDDPFAVHAIMTRLVGAHDDQRAALAGVDSALHDWIGRRMNVPVRRWLGLDLPKVQTSFTIGVADLGEVREKVADAKAAGYTVIKAKVGTDHDDETLALIREKFDGPLLLDANQGWTPGEAPERIRKLARFRPTMIEQPLRKEDWREMAPLRKLGVAPIFADESCERPADVVRLHGCVDGVNIEFTKCGGIHEALQMITLARGLGMQVMQGCFVSTSLAIAPALAIATLADFNDLDGHLLLASDPCEGLAAYPGGIIELPDRPGLGVTPKP